METNTPALGVEGEGVRAEALTPSLLPMGFIEKHLAPPGGEWLFKPTRGCPEQLRPVPFSIYGEEYRHASIHIIRGRKVLSLAVSVGGGYAQMEMAPEAARALAVQLMAAAEQIEDGGAA